MRILGTMAAIALVSSSSIAAAAADYFLQIKGAARESAAGPIYLLADIGDLDGDGVPDEAIVRLNCVGGDVRAAHYNVKSPRDSASGMASGKRTHHPVTFVKEWGPSTPQFFKVSKVHWDLKEAKGARVAADPQGWTPMTLFGTEGLCAAAATAIGPSRARSTMQSTERG